MSQILTPVNGGVVPRIETTSGVTQRLDILSPQFIEVNNLQSRPTEWVPGGRPIYRRLPSTGQTYQIDFFNTLPGGVEEEVGLVYIPWGQGLGSPFSLEVTPSDNRENLFVKAGTLVWRYGRTETIPTILNLQVLDVLPGKYTLGYQLIYDDSPIPLLYAVDDFSLTGIPLTITSSTDSTIGWRYSTINAFLNESDLFWSTEDLFFPTYAQPSSAYLQWQSDLSQAYTKITLRCPTGTTYTGTATLSYVTTGQLTNIITTTISRDSDGQFFEFTITDPQMQTGWNITFSSTVMSIDAITVSGVVTLLEQQSAPSPRATLVMYPFGTLPPTVENSRGEVIPAVYCTLADIDVGIDFLVEKVVDTREITRRDDIPVSDWLTVPFDQDLINLYEQVSGYSSLWMAPTSCMKQEYATLTTDQITVT